jgi:hypothetical protein
MDNETELLRRQVEVLKAEILSLQTGERRAGYRGLLENNPEEALRQSEENSDSLSAQARTRSISTGFLMECTSTSMMGLQS